MTRPVAITLAVLALLGVTAAPTVTGPAGDVQARTQVPHKPA